MDKPSFVSLQVINTCNLRCVQCDYHQEHLGESRLSIEEQCELVRQIGAWDRNIRLKITGGEPFLEKDRLFAVLEQGAGKGLTTFFLTNATLIEPDDIRRMLDLGLGCISVSLDSHNPAVHDAMRGSPGVWHKVERFLREFTAMRSQRGAGTKLWASTILTRQNLDCLEELVIAYEELGFDAIKFQPLFPNYRRQYSEGWKQASPLYPTRDEEENGFRNHASSYGSDSSYEDEGAYEANSQPYKSYPASGGTAGTASDFGPVNRPYPEDAALSPG